MLPRFIKLALLLLLLSQAMLVPTFAKGRKAEKKPEEKKPELAQLTVTVLGANRTIENAQVYLVSTGYNESIKTDEEGKARFGDVPIGKAQLNVIAPGWETFGAEQVLQAGENTRRVDMTALPAATEVTPPEEVVPSGGASGQVSHRQQGPQV